MIRTATPSAPTPAARQRDEGAILPLVLVFSVVLASVVVALAVYASTTLRLGQAAERSSDRLASANGAMDSALEDLERGVGPCLLFGQDYTVTDAVNGMASEVDCTWVGGRFNVGDLFAVVMTGAGAGRTGELLTITNGGNSANAEKVFEGPVYMAATPSPTTMDFRATLAIKNADLSYSAADCGSAVPTPPSELTITPVGYGTQCYEEPWDHPDMFGRFFPPEAGVTNTVAFPVQSSTPPAADLLGCRVWSPGTYTSPPQLDNQSYNYFKSGDYYFNDMGEWAVSSAFVLFGYPGSTGPSIDGPRNNDSFANNPCRDAWTTDAGADRSGATIYLGGNSTLKVDQNATVEISGRDHSGQNIAVQALETNGNPSTIRGDQRIITTGPGSNKQLSIQGLVWAPYAALEFDLISNDAVAALTGGAVVSELSAGASANANNFVIRVATTPANKILNLTTTANSENNQGLTSVRSVVTVQRSQGATAYAVGSRRVVGLTPEIPAPPTTAPPAGTTTTTTTTVPPPTTTTTTTVPLPTDGPCNEPMFDWTHGFGQGDWTADFWNLPSFSGDAPPGDPFSGPPVVSKLLSSINADLGNGQPDSTVNDDYFAARFTRTITVGTGCSVTLRATGDDGYRVFVDGTTVIDDWTSHASTSATGATPTMGPGTHTIVMEFFERTGEAVYELEWRS